MISSELNHPQRPHLQRSSLWVLRLQHKHFQGRQTVHSIKDGEIRKSGGLEGPVRTQPTSPGPARDAAW